MANNNQNIMVAGDAILHLYIGALPKSKWATTVDQELAPEFAGGEIGFITEDGEALNRTVETTNINMHQQVNVRTVVSGGSQEFNFSAGETNKLTQDIFYGTVKAPGATYRTVNASSALTVTFNYDSFDIQQGFEKKIRLAGMGLIYPSAEAPFTRDGVTNYPLTISIQGDMYQSDEIIDEEEAPVEG